MQEGFVKKENLSCVSFFLDIPWAILYTTLIVRIGGVYLISTGNTENTAHFRRVYRIKSDMTGYRNDRKGV